MEPRSVTRDAQIGVSPPAQPAAFAMTNAIHAPVMKMSLWAKLMNCKMP